MSAGFTTPLQALDAPLWRPNWSDTARWWPSPKRNDLPGVHSSMAAEPFLERCRSWYSKLLRFYPKPYRERFGKSMEQTFTDLCRERAKAERGLVRFALWMFFETAAAILKENLGSLRFFLMQKSIV